MKDQFKTLYKQEPKVKFQKNFYVFDTETKITKHGKDYWGLRSRPDAFVFGVVYGYNYCRVIHSVRDFIDEFKHERYKNRLVFAHNAEYDLGVIFDNIYLLDPKAIFNGKFISATNGNCTFGDSMNIYRFSVAKIGEIIGKKKGDELSKNIDYNIPIEYPISSEMINYCIRDCEIVWDALFEFFQMVGDIRLTQASLSMSYFRRHHLQRNIVYNTRLVKYFFNSYYGGRTEAFKVGTVNAAVYDVNSMYPDQMINSKFPDTRKLKRSSHLPINSFMHILDNYEGCALIHVTHKDHFFGFLPYKYDKKLLFPTGSFSTWVNFPEIRLALEYGVIEIKDVQECIYAEPCKSPFKSFINTLYDLRKNCDNELQRTIYKLLMNSLYGKFAQRINTESRYIKNMQIQIDEIIKAQKSGLFIKLDVFNADRMDCFLVTQRRKVLEPSFSIPSYASYITSNARVKLLRFLLENENNLPVYCDTDSAFFNIDPNIEDSNELGEWKKEDKTVTFIRGLKSYDFVIGDNKFSKIKGVPKNAEKIDENTFQYINLIKTKEGLRRNIDSGEQAIRTKVLSNKYTKREILNDGWTKPIKL